MSISAAAALKQVPIFKHLDDRHVQSLAACADHLTLDAGQLVFREGDAPDNLYVILTGRVRVYHEAAGAKRSS